MNTPTPTDPDDTEIAAEFVLRVLGPEAHRAAAVRAASDPAFAAEVRAWEDRLAPMMVDVDPVHPDPAIKSTLMKRLFGADEPKARVTSAGMWQILTGLGFAATAALAVIMVQTRAPAPQEGTEVVEVAAGSRFVAELAVADESTRMFAVINVASGALDLAWTARDQAEGRDLQLWGIPEGGAPISIGILPAGKQATLDVPAEVLAAMAGLTLAISNEPLGGSPTDAPSGEVLATALVSEI